MSIKEAQDALAMYRKCLEDSRVLEDNMEKLQAEFGDTLLRDMGKSAKGLVKDDLPDNTSSKEAFGATDSGAYPLSLLTFWLPLLYTLVQRYVLHTTSSIFDSVSVIPFIAMTLLCFRGDVYRASLKNAQQILDKHNTTTEHVSKAEYTVKIAGERLKNYKLEWQSSRDKVKLMEDNFLDTRDQLLTSAQETRQAQIDARKEINRIRHKLFSSQHEHYQIVVDAIDKLVKRFKNVAVPKVKGVAPKKSSTNSLTSPLERIAAALRSCQAVLEKQIRLTQKIKDILETEGVSEEDMEQLIGQAEKSLNQTPMEALRRDDNGDVGSAFGRLEVNLDEHYDRLDAYHRGLATK